MLLLSLALAGCDDRRGAADHVAESCAAIEASLRHRAQSFEDDPESFLRSVRVEGHGTLPQLAHVRLCARAREESPGALDSVVQEYTVAVDEAQGVSTTADRLSRPEQVRRWRELLSRMADLVHRINERGR